jgi:hypothetical protein
LKASTATVKPSKAASYVGNWVMAD